MDFISQNSMAQNGLGYSGPEALLLVMPFVFLD
jgi:hypothetical protein